MGVETGNYELAAKRFENTIRAMGFRDFRSSRSKSTGGAFKGPYKSGSSLMTCEAELNGLVSRMACFILSHMGTPALNTKSKTCQPKKTKTKYLEKINTFYLVKCVVIESKLIAKSRLAARNS